MKASGFIVLTVASLAAVQFVAAQSVPPTNVYGSAWISGAEGAYTVAVIQGSSTLASVTSSSTGGYSMNFTAPNNSTVHFTLNGAAARLCIPAADILCSTTQVFTSSLMCPPGPNQAPNYLCAGDAEDYDVVIPADSPGGSGATGLGGSSGGGIAANQAPGTGTIGTIVALVAATSLLALGARATKCGSCGEWRDASTPCSCQLEELVNE